MENSVDHINRLLASTLIENNQLAFQLLKGNPALLTEAVFPLLAWKFLVLDFDHIVKDNKHPLNSTGMVDDMLSIVTFLDDAEESVSKPFYYCENLLNFFVEPLDSYSTEGIKEMLKSIHPYLEVYNTYLQAEDFYIEEMLSLAREVYHTYNLDTLIYPFYLFLTTTDSLEIEDKVDFINIILYLSNINKEKYKKALPIALKYADTVITNLPIYAAEYHNVKGLLYQRYGKYQEAITSYENSHKLAPEKETVLNSLAWLLCHHTDRQAEAYTYATKAVKTSPLPNHINTLAHLELIYKKNRIKSKELFEQVLEIDPHHLDSTIMLKKINRKIMLNPPSLS
jgi:tetratricopeptide (TPR) repeat protein